jgi:hypothetical protein
MKAEQKDSNGKTRVNSHVINAIVLFIQQISQQEKT